ncbi:hypothetical protein Z517_07993 [Fonsecaea pedrosoi CBS 271.37]|uniref:Uncharacterized protein n=1 Tax=Fonsecaea pedrosoi CBS 271.37 TaxID=1442368 RepID=A0A0D2GHU3_9EURO|nr:uncharacterized protein Z517_07993 [Fonsecaea pedrosoi CBS 271.37]KIW78160.1 hypothetical protein Z517_07993 [Fonsecaea pedrosoi CBS 271.37]
MRQLDELSAQLMHQKHLLARLGLLGPETGQVKPRSSRSRTLLGGSSLAPDDRSTSFDLRSPALYLIDSLKPDLTIDVERPDAWMPTRNHRILNAGIMLAVLPSVDLLGLAIKSAVFQYKYQYPKITSAPMHLC